MGSTASEALFKAATHVTGAHRLIVATTNGRGISSISVSSKYSIDELLKFAANDLGRLKAAIETHLGSMKYASAALREVS